MGRDGAHLTSLLDHEPELADLIPEEDRDLARRVLTTATVRLERGAWEPPSRDGWPDHAIGLLLIEGLLTREILLGERIAAQLLGPGDVVVPWAGEAVLVPAYTRWTVNEPVHGAVLDARFVAAARRWPALAGYVQEQIADHGARESLHVAICQLGRVEERVLATLWHLAERFGKVGRDGVVVPLRLTHEAIGRLAGAQRPTVTLALQQLAAEGALVKREDGAWLLAEGSRAALASGDETIPARELGTGRVAFTPDESDAPPARQALETDEIRALRERTAALAEGHAARVEQIEATLVRARDATAASRSTRSRIAAARDVRLTRRPAARAR